MQTSSNCEEKLGKRQRIVLAQSHLLQLFMQKINYLQAPSRNCSFCSQREHYSNIERFRECSGGSVDMAMLLEATFPLCSSYQDHEIINEISRPPCPAILNDRQLQTSKQENNSPETGKKTEKSCKISR